MQNMDMYTRTEENSEPACKNAGADRMDHENINMDWPDCYIQKFRKRCFIRGEGIRTCWQNHLKI